jgi:outer membrane lipoprotein-sorting protein
MPSTRILTSILTALVLVPTARVAGQDERALAVLERAGARYAELSGLCADFDQVIEVRLLGETKHSRGRLCQQPPNHFFMEFAEPAGDHIVADGEFLWVYYPSTDDRQVFKAALAGGTGGLDFHREFLAEPGVKYDATYQGRGTLGSIDVHEIGIVPRGAASYQRATVWISEESAMIRKVVLEEENGSVRTVELSALDVDPTVDPARFTFTPPPGAQVLERP